MRLNTILKLVLVWLSQTSDFGNNEIIPLTGAALKGYGWQSHLASTKSHHFLLVFSYSVALRNTNVLYCLMKIRNIRHKGLRGLVEKNSTKGLQAVYVTKIADIMLFLIEIADIEEVFDLKKYKPHSLSGDRQGTYSLTVSANWRITFKYDVSENELYDIDYEDYH